MRRHTRLYYALLLTNIVYRPSREVDSNSRKSNDVWTCTGKAHPDRRETSISNLLRQRNLKTEVSLWKFKENAKKFKNETIAVIWDLLLSLHYRFHEMIPVNKQTKNPASPNSSCMECVSEKLRFHDGRTKHNNKPAFSKFSGVAWTVPIFSAFHW